MSQTAVPYPIVAALRAAAGILGPDRSWQPTTAAQERFCREWLEPGYAGAAAVPEIATCALWSATELEAFLRARGFSVQLGRFAPPSFGVACILDLRARWRHPGAEDVVWSVAGTRYPVARLDSGVSFHRAPEHREPVATVQVANGDLAYLSVLDEEPTPATSEPTAFELVARALRIERVLEPSTGEFGGLVFPKVALDLTASLGWLAGLRRETAQGGPAEVGAALQRTRLRVNERGARVQSAAALTIRPIALRLAPADLVIDRPFLLWFRRPGLVLPLAVFHLTPETWRDPGPLG